MAYAVLTIPHTDSHESSLKTKVIVLSAEDALKQHVIKLARDQVNKSASFLADGNRLSFNDAKVDVYQILDFIESGGYELSSMSTGEKSRTVYVFKKK